MNNTTFDSLPLLLTVMKGKELLGAVYLDFNLALAQLYREKVN